MASRLSILAVTTALTASLISPAFAQTSDDEIIVTATKRATTLQETPVAVTVTSAATIENARILDLNDLQSVVPSLRVNQLQTSTNTNFIIRGFGNGANNAGVEPSVGVFVDGVYRSRSAARIGDLPKLERIEVLRGPQSTLFGKNASAGVISIVTAKPSYEQEGYAELGYGNYNNFTGKAPSMRFAARLPISKMRAPSMPFALWAGKRRMPMTHLPASILLTKTRLMKLMIGVYLHKLNMILALPT